MTTRNNVDLLKTTGSTWLQRTASVKLTLVCVLLAMILVLIGTLAQVHLGTFLAQKVYFNSWFIYAPIGSFKVPVFLGGLSVGALWMGNLIASFITRFRLNKDDIGIFISHTGIILLLLGQFLTQTLAHESMLSLEVGSSGNYAEDSLHTELVVIKTSGQDSDDITSIPEARFSRGGEIHPPQLPFYLIIRRFYKNAQLGMAGPGATSMATQGIGTRISLQEIPPTYAENETNNVSAYIEVHDATRSLGVWLISSGLGAPQSFNVQGSDYVMYIRPKRVYLPFTLTLKEFRHDIYPGTDIPKNFSSLVQLNNPITNEARTSLIYMNHPLRYQGRTFYQASFGEGDKLSVFQVMENPVSMSPYIACAMVILGLIIQFMAHLIKFVGSRR